MDRPGHAGVVDGPGSVVWGCSPRCRSWIVAVVSGCGGPGRRPLVRHSVGASPPPLPFRNASETPMRIALDAMGGDHAPGPIVSGAIEAVNDQPDLTVVL